MSYREFTRRASGGVWWWVAVSTAAIIALIGAGISSADPGTKFVTFSSYSLDLGTCTFGGSLCSKSVVETNVSDQTLTRTGEIIGPFQVIESECIPRTGPFVPGMSCNYRVALGLNIAPGRYHGKVCFDYADAAPPRICIRVTAELAG